MSDDTNKCSATPLDTAIANNKNGRNQDVVDYLISVGAETTINTNGGLE